MDAKTTSDAAKILGVTPQALSRVCAKHGIGTVVNPRLRLLSSADIETLRGLVRSKPGNPNFGKQTAKPAPAAKRTPAKRRPDAKP